VKARKVTGLDPRAPLDANAARIVATRLDELRLFGPDAVAGNQAQAQHDMRIAAKRLRYVLETVGLCLGEAADDGRRAARDIQSVLGDLHDCDVLIAMVERHTSKPGAPATDRGLELSIARTVERRDRLHAEFAALWSKLDREGVWDRLERVTASERDSD
jgi:CHAD domain-containing protein